MAEEWIPNRYISEQMQELLGIIKELYPEADVTEIEEKAREGKIPNPFILESAKEEWKRALAGLIHLTNFNALVILLPHILTDYLREKTDKKRSQLSNFIKAASGAFNKAIKLLAPLSKTLDIAIDGVRSIGVLLKIARISGIDEDVLFIITLFFDAIAHQTPLKQIILLNNAAASCGETDQLDLALIMLDEAEKICRSEIEQGNRKLMRELGPILLNKGHALYGMQRYDEALQNYIEAENVYKELARKGDKDAKIGLARAAANKGRVYYTQKKLDIAKKMFEDAENHFKPAVDEGKHVGEYVDVIIDKSQVLKDMNKFDDALKELEKAEKIVNENVEKGMDILRDKLVTISLVRGRIYNAMKKFSDAVNEYSKAEEICRGLIRIGRSYLLPLLPPILTEKTVALEAAGKIDDALTASESAMVMARHMIFAGHIENIAEFMTASKIRIKILDKKGEIERAISVCKYCEENLRTLANQGIPGAKTSLIEILLIKEKLLRKVGKEEEANKIKEEIKSLRKC